MNTYSHAEKPKDFTHAIFQFNKQVLNLNEPELRLLNAQELEWSKKAVLEELEEFIQAHRQQDFVGAVDAVGDLVYFAIGFFFRMGLTPDQVNQVMMAINDANMEKKLGKVAARNIDGVADATKPEGWVGPEERIAAILG
ncbi:hypothetical protein [Xanthomonas phage Xp15]|uniref:Uncharacterized protein n=1 Tax=Xanthomonas phage Xp15 TaxID=322855 RepID=Q52PN8_9CAUD|nr:hydrolase [Xanthomonas phage Xp15]AAX84877.1 hypothetical protein [Xanthomonas phage Xp15]